MRALCQAKFYVFAFRRHSDIPLRFLTHFVGDLHQPLHLTGKLKGGNGGKRMSRFDLVESPAHHDVYTQLGSGSMEGSLSE